jgi:hypothetical protein
MKVSFCCIGPGTGAATADTSGLSAGAIAAIILAVLFILLAIIAIIICCYDFNPTLRNPLFSSFLVSSNPQSRKS